MIGISPNGDQFMKLDKTNCDNLMTKNVQYWQKLTNSAIIEVKKSLAKGENIYATHV